MIYQIKVTLEGITPPIWRRIEIAPNTSLEDFHYVLQTTMGWTNSHLHHFIVGREFYNPHNEFDDFGTDYSGLVISDFLSRPNQKIRYEYDMGDSWQHEIKLEKIIELKEGIFYPRCVKGKRECPPEDCGGVWGYMELIEIMKDPKHESHKEMVEWYGGIIDPEDFDLEEINIGLKGENYGMSKWDI